MKRPPNQAETARWSRYLTTEEVAALRSTIAAAIATWPPEDQGLVVGEDEPEAPAGTPLAQGN